MIFSYTKILLLAHEFSNRFTRVFVFVMILDFDFGKAEWELWKSKNVFSVFKILCKSKNLKSIIFISYEKKSWKIRSFQRRNQTKQQQKLFSWSYKLLRPLWYIRIHQNTFVTSEKLKFLLQVLIQQSNIRQ